MVFHLPLHQLRPSVRHQAQPRVLLQRIVPKILQSEVVSHEQSMAVIPLAVLVSRHSLRPGSSLPHFVNIAISRMEPYVPSCG
jgi:hypothetical protein